MANTPMFTVDEGKTLRFQNGVSCGVIYEEVDGYHVWGPPNNSGSWESAPLRAIADLLDDMNAEWDRIVKSDPRVTRQEGVQENG